MCYPQFSQNIKYKTNDGLGPAYPNIKKFLLGDRLDDLGHISSALSNLNNKYIPDINMVYIVRVLELYQSECQFLQSECQFL